MGQASPSNAGRHSRQPGTASHPEPSTHRARRGAAGLPGTRGGAAARVVVVDDNEWVRRGRLDALRELGWAGDAVALDHDDALGATWMAGDTVLVDAHDPSRPWDRYVGIAVVSAVRTQVGDHALVVVMTDGPPPAALRDRAAEAGADYVASHERTRNLPELVALLRDPDAAAERLRIGRRGLTAALDVIDELAAHALFTAPIPQKQSDLSRRNIITLRQRLARTLGLDRPPRLRDLIDTINDARGATGATVPARSLSDV